MHPLSRKVIVSVSTLGQFHALARGEKGDSRVEPASFLTRSRHAPNAG